LNYLNPHSGHSKLMLLLINEFKIETIYLHEVSFLLIQIFIHRIKKDKGNTQRTDSGHNLVPFL
jgi:hypothetical protein